MFAPEPKQRIFLIAKGVLREINNLCDVFPAYLAFWAGSEPLAWLESLEEIAVAEP